MSRGWEGCVRGDDGWGGGICINIAESGVVIEGWRDR